jgi:hypothetical protein
VWISAGMVGILMNSYLQRQGSNESQLGLGAVLCENDDESSNELQRG